MYSSKLRPNTFYSNKWNEVNALYAHAMGVVEELACLESLQLCLVPDVPNLVLVPCSVSVPSSGSVFLLVSVVRRANKGSGHTSCVP